MKLLVTLILTAVGLSGCYPAIFVAATSTGVTLSQDRSFGDAIDDNTIWAKIEKALASESSKKLFSKITVKVYEGRVMLTGSVSKNEDNLRAVEICWNQRGVKEVVNELQVNVHSAKANPLRFTRDTWISSQLNSQIFFGGSVKRTNYTIVVFDSIVYLFGLAKNQEELEKVATAAAKVKGVEKVISHVMLIDSLTRNELQQEFKH